MLQKCHQRAQEFLPMVEQFASSISIQVTELAGAIPDCWVLIFCSLSTSVRDLFVDCSCVIGMYLVAGIRANASFLTWSSDYKSDQRDKQAKDEGPEEMRKHYLIGSTFFFFKFLSDCWKIIAKRGMIIVSFSLPDIFKLALIFACYWCTAH